MHVETHVVIENMTRYDGDVTYVNSELKSMTNRPLSDPPRYERRSPSGVVCMLCSPSSKTKTKQQEQQIDLGKNDDRDSRTMSLPLINLLIPENQINWF